MEIEREVLVQLAVGGGATVLFIAMVALVGIREGGRALTTDGVMLLVGVIVAFVVLLAVLGLAFSDQITAD